MTTGLAGFVDFGGLRTPHKLVLTKTADVFRRDVDRRLAVKAELETVERLLATIAPPA